MTAADLIDQVLKPRKKGLRERADRLRLGPRWNWTALAAPACFTFENRAGRFPSLGRKTRREPRAAMRQNESRPVGGGSREASATSNDCFAKSNPSPLIRQPNSRSVHSDGGGR